MPSLDQYFADKGLGSDPAETTDQPNSLDQYFADQGWESVPIEEPAPVVTGVEPAPEDDTSAIGQAYRSAVTGFVEPLLSSPLDAIGIAQYNFVRKYFPERLEGQEDKSLEDMSGFNWAAAKTRQGVELIVPDESVRYRENFWATDAPNAIGNVLGFWFGGKGIGAGIKKAAPGVGKGIGRAAEKKALTRVKGKAAELGAKRGIPLSPTVINAAARNAAKKDAAAAIKKYEYGVRLGSVAPIAAPLEMVSQFKDAMAHLEAKAAAEGRSLTEEEREMAWSAYKQGSWVGLLELVPMARYLKFLDKVTPAGTVKKLKDVFVSGSYEAGQEFTQTMASNYIAAHSVGYDEGRSLFEGSLRAGGAGGVAGAFMTTLSMIVGRRVNFNKRAVNHRKKGEDYRAKAQALSASGSPAQAQAMMQLAASEDAKAQQIETMLEQFDKEAGVPTRTTGTDAAVATTVDPDGTVGEAGVATPAVAGSMLGTRGQFQQEIPATEEADSDLAVAEDPEAAAETAAAEVVVGELTEVAKKSKKNKKLIADAKKLGLINEDGQVILSGPNQATTVEVSTSKGKNKGKVTATHLNRAVKKARLAAKKATKEAKKAAKAAKPAAAEEVAEDPAAEAEPTVTELAAEPAVEALEEELVPPIELEEEGLPLLEDTQTVEELEELGLGEVAAEVAEADEAALLEEAQPEDRVAELEEEIKKDEESIEAYERAFLQSLLGPAYLEDEDAFEAEREKLKTGLAAKKLELEELTKDEAAPEEAELSDKQKADLRAADRQYLDGTITGEELLTRQAEIRQEAAPTEEERELTDAEEGALEAKADKQAALAAEEEAEAKRVAEEAEEAEEAEDFVTVDGVKFYVGEVDAESESVKEGIANIMKYLRGAAKDVNYSFENLVISLVDDAAKDFHYEAAPTSLTIVYANVAKINEYSKHSNYKHRETQAEELWHLYDAQALWLEYQRQVEEGEIPTVNGRPAKAWEEFYVESQEALFDEMSPAEREFSRKTYIDFTSKEDADLYTEDHFAVLERAVEDNQAGAEIELSKAKMAIAAEYIRIRLQQRSGKGVTEGKVQPMFGKVMQWLHNFYTHLTGDWHKSTMSTKSWNRVKEAEAMAKLGAKVVKGKKKGGTAGPRLGAGKVRGQELVDDLVASMEKMQKADEARQQAKPLPPSKSWRRIIKSRQRKAKTKPTPTQERSTKIWQDQVLVNENAFASLPMVDMEGQRDVQFEDLIYKATASKVEELSLTEDDAGVGGDLAKELERAMHTDMSASDREDAFAYVVSRTLNVARQHYAKHGSMETFQTTREVDKQFSGYLADVLMVPSETKLSKKGKEYTEKQYKMVALTTKTKLPSGQVVTFEDLVAGDGSFNNLDKSAKQEAVRTRVTLAVDAMEGTDRIILAGMLSGTPTEQVAKDLEVGMRRYWFMREDARRNFAKYLIDKGWATNSREEVIFSGTSSEAAFELRKKDESTRVVSRKGFKQVVRDKPTRAEGHSGLMWGLRAGRVDRFDMAADVLGTEATIDAIGEGLHQPLPNLSMEEMALVVNGVVLYHGTASNHAEAIMEAKFQPGKTMLGKAGEAVYFTPNEKLTPTDEESQPAWFSKNAVSRVGGRPAVIKVQSSFQRVLNGDSYFFGTEADYYQRVPRPDMERVVMDFSKKAVGWERADEYAEDFYESLEVDTPVWAALDQLRARYRAHNDTAMPQIDEGKWDGEVNDISSDFIPSVLMKINPQGKVAKRGDSTGGYEAISYFNSSYTHEGNKVVWQQHQTGDVGHEREVALLRPRADEVVEEYEEGEVLPNIMELQTRRLLAGKPKPDDTLGELADEVIEQQAERAANNGEAPVMPIPPGKGVIAHIRHMLSPHRWAIGGEDVLRRAGLNDLADQLREYFDAESVLLGKLFNGYGALQEKYDYDQWETAKNEFSEYMMAREQQATDPEHQAKLRAGAEAMLAKMSEGTKELVAWQKQIAVETGATAQQLNIQVYDPAAKKGTGGWRLIGNLGEWHFPRMFKQETFDVISNRNHPDYRDRYQQMLRDLVENGNAEDMAEADRILKPVYNDTTGGDYLANIERARGVKLPDKYYETRVEAYLHFLRRYAERVSQIHAFGQKVGGQAKDAWDIAKDDAGDAKLEKMIDSLQKAVYRTQPKNIGQDITTYATGVASILYLSSVLTSLRNLTSALRMNLETFGIWNTTKGFGQSLAQSAGATLKTARKVGSGDWTWKFWEEGAKTATADMVAETHALGALRMDFQTAQLLDLHDESPWYNPKSAKAALMKGNQLALWMHGATERMGRSISHVAAMQWLRSSTELINSEQGSWKKRLATMKRLGFRSDADLQALVNGEANMVERFIRSAVREKQYSYDVSQSPLVFSHAGGRLFLQFQRWGFQRLRDLGRNVIAPALGKPATVKYKGKELMVERDFAPLARMMLLSVGAGELYALLRGLLTDRERKEAPVAEIRETYDDDKARAIWLATERIANNYVLDGGMGILGDYSQLAYDTASRGWRYKNPLEPPSIQIGKQAVSLLTKRLQRGSLTEGFLTDDIPDLLYSIPMLRVAKAVPTRLLDWTGSEMDFVQRQQAWRDVSSLRNAARRFSKETGLDEGRKMNFVFDAKTPNTYGYDRMHDALMIGDFDEARKLRLALVKAEKKPADRKKKLLALRTSVRNRQPLKVGGVENKEARAAFLKWLRSRRPDQVESLMRIQKRYKQAAARAGLM
tara:strand:- start:105 stop:8222 length:8118 start_codon:yes stop_codon:yes gene_type:complete